MAKYTLKPIDVEAIQFDGDFDKLKAWIIAITKDEYFYFKFVEGYYGLKSGDWVTIYKDDVKFYSNKDFHELHELKKEHG